MNSDPKTTASLHDLIERLSHGIKMDFEVKRMEPLFTDEADYEKFRTRHASHDVKKGDLATYEGNCYLGIDAGSTTTKVALVGEDALHLPYHQDIGYEQRPVAGEPRLHHQSLRNTYRKCC